MSNFVKVVLAAVIFGSITLAVLIPTLLIRAFVLYKLWDWFVVTLGAPSIGLWHTLGLLVTVNFVTFNGYKKYQPDKEVEEQVLAVLVPAVRALIALVVGYSIKIIMFGV